MKNIEQIYPLVIIGSGPAGLTASIYASRYKIKHLLIGEVLGGLAFEAHKICNYPSEQEIKGAQLVSKIQASAESLGMNMLIDKVISISRGVKRQYFEIRTQGKKDILAHNLLLTIGTKHRKLNLPKEKEFLGHGVSYCATCDAMFYKDKEVAVVGGSDSANTASLYLAEIAKKVYQIYRRDKLRGDPTWAKQVKENKNIEVIFNNQVTALKGEDNLESVVLEKPYRSKTTLRIEGLFIEIGTVPQQEIIQELSLGTNEKGYIEVTREQRTNQANIWAAGDITDGSNNFRQIITACSEAAIAVENIFTILQREK